MWKKYNMRILQSLKKASINSFIILLMLGPLLCFVLEGFQLEFKPLRAAWLIGIVFCTSFGFELLKHNTYIERARNAINQQFKQRVPIENLKLRHPGWMWLIFLACLCLPLFISKYWLSIAILCLIYILLGLGLNIVVGLAGLLNLGFVAFYAIGAYSFALGAQYLHLGFWSALPFAALLAALLGALLAFPVLRMYGDYLAIVTLGFGEIVRLILNNWSDFTGGPNGMSVPVPQLFHLSFSSQPINGKTPFHEFFHIPYDTLYRYLFIYILLLLIVALTILLIARLRRMPLGQAFEALREDEIACRSLGINHVSTKLWAFSLSAMIGGIGGVFFASLEGFVSPSSFTFIESALILSIVVLGGMGSTVGVILAAVILTVLPEFLRDFSEYRMLVFGALMIMMMIWRPQGLIKFARFSFEKPK